MLERMTHMTSVDSNAASNSGSSNDLSRTCEICDAEMTHLSDLQPRLDGGPLRVFRCYDCNHVASEEM
jgi:hypothetical protein